MPTWDASAGFWLDLGKLLPAERDRFRDAVHALVDDLTAGRQPRPQLRVKGVQGSRGVYEMTWAADGRATFQYGERVLPGQAHVVWRRVGTHKIFRRP